MEIDKKSRGPQTAYETKPHIKQHSCCTWQGHPWHAISTVVAAENRPKDDVVSCRVCFVSGDIVDPKQQGQANEGPRSRCFTLGLWFHVGFRADFVMFFFHVVSCRVYVCDAWCIEIHCFETGRTPQVSLRSRPWRGLSKIRCFMSGWGFVSGLRVPKKCPNKIDVIAGKKKGGKNRRAQNLPPQKKT